MSKVDTLFNDDQNLTNLTFLYSNLLHDIDTALGKLDEDNHWKLVFGREPCTYENIREKKITL